jgi:alkaline phosphatase D
MKKSICLVLLLFTSSLGFGQNSDFIQSGPMLGYVEMREALVWVQYKEPVETYLKVWEPGAQDTINTTIQNSNNESANVIKFIIADLEPGRIYQYDIYVNNKLANTAYRQIVETQQLWQYRTDPPNFKFATGSCAYINEHEYDRPGKGYGGNYEIFQNIVSNQPNMMLWLGDITYLREADFYSKKAILNRNTHSRSLPELQELLVSCNHYAIWDDHDFGPNDAVGSFPHKDKTLDAFKLFWGNNGYGVNGNPGITGFFKYNDIDFFLLDNRYNRTPLFESEKSQVLGKKQIDWLISELKLSKSPFKFIAVGGQVLNTAKVHENHANYEEERAYLLKKLKDENIKNVIFLTGDRHHTELSKLDDEGYVTYDLTVSPLTASAARLNEKEINTLHVEGTRVNQRNYALIEVSGPRKERELYITIIGSDGHEIWNKKISSEDF